MKKENDKTIYARPKGRHYHFNKDCVMLRDGDFEKFGYTEVTWAEVNKRKLFPCACAFDERREGLYRGRT